MTQELLTETLKKSFFNDFSLHKRRNNLYQILLPLYYEDGDMMDIFIDTSNDQVSICDCGLTLMHLSYSFDITTEKQKRILSNILAESGATNDDGDIRLKVSDNMLFETIMQMSQIISRISSMKMLQKKAVASLFYEQLSSYIDDSFKQYHVEKNYVPIADRDELKVDYAFISGNRPIYVFAVKGDAKAQKSVISMLSFQKENMPFTGIVVHENYSHLRQDTQKVIMNVADKQYYDFTSFTSRKNDFTKKYLQ